MSFNQCLAFYYGKSTLISGTAERERNRFFFTMREKIQILKQNI